MCCDQTCATDWGLFLFSKTPLDSFCWDCDGCGFLPLPRTRAVAAYGACFEIPWSLATGLQIPAPVYARKMLERHKSHFKARLRKKGVLGLPLLHHNSARFTCVWVVPSSIFLTLFCSIYECLSPHPRRWPTTLRLIIDVGTTQVPDMCCFLVWCGEVLTGVL